MITADGISKRQEFEVEASAQGRRKDIVSAVVLQLEADSGVGCIAGQQFCQRVDELWWSARWESLFKPAAWGKLRLNVAMEPARLRWSRPRREQPGSVQ